MADADQIEIHAGDIDRPYTVIGPVKANASATTIVSKRPTADQGDENLRAAAAKVGADAVINVSSKRGVSMRSWKALKVEGTAVTFD